MTEPGGAMPKFAREAWIRALTRTAALEGATTLTLPALLDGQALEHGPAAALSSPGASLSYAELAARLNRYARWGLAQGLGPGDAVALLMQNSAEYPAVWLGLSRIGVAVALVNAQLSGEALAHCIRAAAPRLVLVSAELASSVAAVRASLPAALAAFVVDGVVARDLDAWFRPLELDGLAGGALAPHEFTAPTLDSTALYIYTSGTTGLPKAAHVTHYRVLRWSQWFAGLLDTGPADRMYDCLPLYHSVGGVVAIGALLVAGGSVVIRPRFSAIEFLARRARGALHAVPVHRRAVPLPGQRAARAGRGRASLRIACGNGLRPEVWESFQIALQDSAHPRVLRLHRGQFLALQLRGTAGRHRPHPLVPRAPAAGGAGALRSGDRRARAQCSRLLRALRRR